MFSDLGLEKTSTNLLDIADQFCEIFFVVLTYFLEVLHLLMISQEHTKIENMNALVKSHLKRKISLAKSEPQNKSIKIGDEIKEPKLNAMKRAD